MKLANVSGLKHLNSASGKWKAYKALGMVADENETPEEKIGVGTDIHAADFE